MLTAYAISATGLAPIAIDAPAAGTSAAWLDLFAPTAEEEHAAEAFLGALVPTREETQEIEFSSRFYVENGVVFMTASVLAGLDAGHPVLTPFTFGVGKTKIVTLRYEDMKAFRQFLAIAPKPDSGCGTPAGIFNGLLEAFIARTADVLEHIAQAVDRINSEIFTRKASERIRSKRLSILIGAIGMQGDLASKARESLSSLERLAQYAAAMLPDLKNGNNARLKLALRDVRSLEDHVNFVLNKITFLLDATLGLVANQQNQVVSVLTVASTILMPPTLIGTIYGMNFKDMPELGWGFGYPLALVIMVVSALVPFLYFKRRGWL
ncbi:magnesium transporter CorA family protein [Kaistia nematophila]|uniref:Magnesium transport protein CorA n=1 Tax=Kaistia nematophila TaxID=2994654 RepID=A0A9X3E5H4_9HYPH|nr:magnesium transporter CorA family protein [Kaistia nematophila]MCX5571737.1 magnesium transporter CorA family protein [Kaistia nematophila]